MKNIWILLLLIPGTLMAYDIHISKVDWWEASKNPITIEEWKQFCEKDVNIRIETEVTGRNPATGEIILIPGDAICFWTDPESKEEFIFDYRDGKISFGHNKKLMPKAKEIASKLGAKVQGDEGEEY